MKCQSLKSNSGKIFINVNHGKIGGIQRLYFGCDNVFDFFVRKLEIVGEEKVKNDIGVRRSLDNAEIVQGERTVQLRKKAADGFF